MLFRLILVAVALIIMPGNANANWQRATSDNFIVYSNGNEDGLRKFTAKVEAFDSLLRLVTGLKAPPAPKRLEIYLLRDQAAIHKLLGRGGRNIAGLYRPRMSGAIALVPRSGGNDKYDLDGETVLFHEYAHHFMMQYFASAYPPWYVEGFAEFYSTAEMDSEKGTASIGKPAYHRAYGLTLSATFPIKRLLSDDPAPQGLQEGDAYYGRAWLLTHMLSFLPARDGQLKTYLYAYANGVPAEKAAIDAFGPTADLDKDLKRYLLARKMSYRKLSGLSIKAASVKIDAVSPAEDGLMLERLSLWTGVDDEAKPRFLAELRKEIALFPDSPYALDLLAEAENLAENDAAAAAANEALLKLKPDHIAGLLRKAEALAESEAEVEDDSAHWKTVRSLIVKANRADNDNPVALFQYYQSYQRQGIAPPKLAVSGLFRAYQLAPQSDEIRMVLARQFMKDDDYQSARNALMPVAYAPHGGGSSDAAREIITMIDARQPSDAKAAESNTESGK